MREQFVPANIFQVDKSQRIYISRKDAKGRKTLNESELGALLTRFGIRTVVLSEMQVIDQIALFSEVNLVIAPHGADIVSTVCSNKVSLIELFPDDANTDMGHVFYQTSRMYLESHTVLLCQSAENNNMSVDLKKLKHLIENLDK